MLLHHLYPFASGCELWIVSEKFKIVQEDVVNYGSLVFRT